MKQTLVLAPQCGETFWSNVVLILRLHESLEVLSYSFIHLEPRDHSFATKHGFQFTVRNDIATIWVQNIQAESLVHTIFFPPPTGNLFR